MLNIDTDAITWFEQDRIEESHPVAESNGDA